MMHTNICDSERLEHILQTLSGSKYQPCTICNMEMLHFLMLDIVYNYFK
jgi:hypothetical protein